MEQFPHLNFVQKVTGSPRLFGGGSDSQLTIRNKLNRPVHSSNLFSKTSQIKETWYNAYFNRDSQSLAELDKDIIPVFLRMNPDKLTNEFDLQKLNIEIISEEENGFIVGASLDGLRTLEEKISEFTSKVHGSGKIADLWEIIQGNQWKPEHILSEEIYTKWDSVDDNVLYNLEVSIAFDKPLGKEPDPTKQGGETRLRKFRVQQAERENLLIERETDFENFINHYGKITSGLVDIEDSFACQVKISGKGLKDLVFNYPFVFEVSETEEIGGVDGELGLELDSDIEILPPEAGSVEVGIIDSGIMENHKYISLSINNEDSKSYINGVRSTADQVREGGHGTKVAGAVLYPIGVSNLESPYQLPCFIRNIKVLNYQNKLTDKFPAELMQRIINENADCKIFNLSINSREPFRLKHMSSWAATIDSLIHEKNILFIISVGNIPELLIQEYLNNGETYPEYLQKPLCRLANPAQSCFALSVGSINHTQFKDENWSSLGVEGDISAFSRIGSGIWGEIKPDVVELGGGLNVSRNGRNLITEHESTSPELLRSTLNGGSAIGRDNVGTSFATPKVSHIVAQLSKLYPDENINLIRAMVVQGARLPNHHFNSPTKESIQQFGFGLPSLDRVTKNTEQRITFYNTGTLCVQEGHIYSLEIPQELRNQADEFEMIIEVTLAYSAKVRRTRQKTKSYLSTWLDWTTSKIDETFEEFKDYALKEIDNDETEYDRDTRSDFNNFKWKINNRRDSGDVLDIIRSNSTVQKDWAFLKSYELPSEISFAVRAHKGWSNENEEVPYALVVSIEVLNANIPIYEQIRLENEIEIPIGL